MAKVCVYCGSPKGDKEHGFPKWLQRYMNPDRTPVRAQVPGGKIIPYGGWDMSIVQAMCTPCNQWMATTFEDDAAPLIKRMDAFEQFWISPRERRNLARWAYKTSLMVECSFGDEHTLTDWALRSFRSSGFPPPGDSIVIGMTLEPHVAYHRTQFRRVLNGQAIQGMSIFLCVGHVFFHFARDLEFTYGLRTLLPDSYGVALMPVWPREPQPLGWPLDYEWPAAQLEKLATFGGQPFSFVSNGPADRTSP